MIVLDNNENIYTVIYLLPIPAAPAGNITQAVRSYPWLPGQTFTETFAYDSTNQLVSAANPQTYALSVTYGDWGKILQYGLSQTDLANNLTTSVVRNYGYGSLSEGQTSFAPNNITDNNGTNVNEQYGINGSLQRRETTVPGNPPSEELYRFGADGNLRLYSYDRLFYSLYGYDAGTTRTYKYSMDMSPNWLNGRLESVNFNMRNAMFYPNSYLNFNNDGHYTKHYYNGMERIASRLGDRNISINVNDPELQDRKWQLDSNIRRNIVDITGYEFLHVGEEQDPDDPKPVFELPQVGLTNLIPNTSSVFYYHTNHLGSTCYVTDENMSVVQGFLYAPFGEITNEHNSSFGNGVIPKYSFNAKELDEETGMYYYEARYMAPPTFISRDPLFEKYPTFTPYAYCANNPIKYVDPDGRDWYETEDGKAIKWTWCHSQQKMDEKKINGKYLGITASANGIYYGLLGDIVKENSERGRAIKALDQTIINRAKAEVAGLSFFDTESVDFSGVFKFEKGWKSNNTRSYNYGGGEATIFMRGKDTEGALKVFEKDDVLSGAMAGNYRVNPPRYNIDSKGGFRRGPIASFSFYNKPSAHSNYKKMYDYLKSGKLLMYSIKKGQKWSRSLY